MAKNKLVEKVDALKLAKEIGCSGAHQDEKGNWMPCASMEELERISNIAETGKWRSVVPGYKKSEKVRKQKGKRKRTGGWENLRESPVMGIVSLEGGGLVSGNLFAGKALDCCGSKAATPELVRDNDADVFIDPDSARSRSRQLGCIGISRRMSRSGRTVWMPCTNMTDYANRAGTTALGRRNIEKRRQNEVRQAVRTILSSAKKTTVKRKTAITDDLRQK